MWIALVGLGMLLFVVIVLLGVFVPVTRARVHTRAEKQSTVLLLDSDQDRPISDRMLIGTHGSAAYRLDLGTLVADRGFNMKKYGHWTPDLTRRWAINQVYSLYDQLRMGVRFLHLEISLHKEEWCTIHSYKAGTLFEDVHEIRRFVLLPDSSHFTLLYPQLFDNKPSDVDSSGRTYLEAIADILGTCQRSYRPRDPMVTYYNRVAIVDAASAQSPHDDTTTVSTFLHNHVPISKRSDRFLHWVMTPGLNTIVRSICLPFTSPKSLSTLYPNKHENLTAYLRTVPPLQCQCIIVDHVDPEFVAIVDAHNRD
jgi:hypothetical protein